MALGRIEITNITKSAVLCPTALQANTFVSRLRGVLGNEETYLASGLWLTPSSCVHTFGMQNELDIVALDRDLRVIGLWESVGPGKVRGFSLRTKSVLELQSGHARRCGLIVGDQLAVQPVAAKVN
ncbi:MAG: DUF192 domain-containing protein [Janthinobacterium lividum]